MSSESLLRRVRGRAGRAIPRAILNVVGPIANGRALPLCLIMAIRRFGTGNDPLVPHLPLTPASALGEPLAAHLPGRNLGAWSLGPKSFGFLEAIVSRDRPALAIEFGSGISTAFLALSMRNAGAAGDRPIVISFEQDIDEAMRTQELLSNAGLIDLVRLVVAPLERQLIEGISTTCYVLPEYVGHLFADRRADLVLVDGPWAEPGARFGTLPLARPFVSPYARFVVDDALRDGELLVARRWSSLPYVCIEGIRVIEHGLLTGEINGP